MIIIITIIIITIITLVRILIYWFFYIDARTIPQHVLNEVLPELEPKLSRHDTYGKKSVLCTTLQYVQHHNRLKIFVPFGASAIKLHDNYRERLLAYNFSTLMKFLANISVGDKMMALMSHAVKFICALNNLNEPIPFTGLNL